MLVIGISIAAFILGRTAGFCLAVANSKAQRKVDKVRAAILELERAEAEIEHCEYREKNSRCNSCEHMPVCHWAQEEKS